MTDLLVRDPHRHMRHQTRTSWYREGDNPGQWRGDRPATFCGSDSVRSRKFALVEDWALVTCQKCCIKRINDALAKAGHSRLRIYEAAAKQLGVNY